MFAGISALAMGSEVHVVEDPAPLIGAPGGYVQRTVLAQRRRPCSVTTRRLLRGPGVHRADPGPGGEHRLQRLPHPRLDPRPGQFLPRQLSRRGDRLVFSNGILILAGARGRSSGPSTPRTTRLIQLYIVGVFVSFTLSQSGMVVHWLRVLRQDRRPRARSCTGPRRQPRWRDATALVLVIVLVTKFTHGAWMVVVAIPVLCC